jgi:hypothetical protein
LPRGNPPRFADPEKLARTFLWQEERTVDKTACFSCQGNRYAVVSALVGKKIRVRYDPFDLNRRKVFCRGRQYPDAVGHRRFSEQKRREQAKRTLGRIRGFGLLTGEVGVSLYFSKYQNILVLENVKPSPQCPVPPQGFLVALAFCLLEIFDDNALQGQPAFHHFLHAVKAQGDPLTLTVLVANHNAQVAAHSEERERVVKRFAEHPQKLFRACGVRQVVSVRAEADDVVVRGVHDQQVNGVKPHLLNRASKVKNPAVPYSNSR